MDRSPDGAFEVLWEDGERVFCRTSREGDPQAFLAVLPAAEHPSRESLRRLANEYALKERLESAWAVRPLELVRARGRTMLMLESLEGEPLERLMDHPMEIGRFLRLSIALSGVLRRVHERGLVHKDIKPTNILVNSTTDQVWLMGFGIASQLLRERQSPEPPELIQGTLAYMAPEQTGRMNRSIDSRSDLYSLGVTLYQMLTGCLPFTASDPMEWVHCHIARAPPPPLERVRNIPPVVSAIVIKLLAKTAEERYQTASGLEGDLRRCLAAWETRQRIDDFPLGERDAPDRLFIPEKLYGRAREVEMLFAAFDRVLGSGVPELVLVSGYSGIGKSSVVNELHKVLVLPRGLFAAGKFDQYRRDIPYSTLVQAFRSLVRSFLGKSDTELAVWRSALLQALDLNARLMTDLIPELKLIIGEPPALPELEPQHAQHRFRLVLRRFIGVFATAEHPLALFLDDLQWLDAATLDLLQDLLTRSDLRHLMLIGAYRDNEVDAANPLIRKLDAIHEAGGRVHEIRLAPLTPHDLGQLIADSLHCDPIDVAPLAQLVHDKTSGNPFFVIQFLYSLAQEGLLRFNYDSRCWSWDLGRMHDRRYTDNVVDLMLGRLSRLPVETQQALQRLASLSNAAPVVTLSIILEVPVDQVHATLWPAVRQELIERLGGSYKFIHDRVQEAAYSLIPETLRAEVHLQIGRLLVKQTPSEKREEGIFEIVNQLNRGAALISEQEERKQLAELNLIAGKRAMQSTAYASALTYLTAGAALLTGDARELRHDLVFELEQSRAECELLTGALATAEERLKVLSACAATTVQRAGVACLQVDLYATLDQSSRSIAVGLDYLRHLGIGWSAHPTDEEARGEYDRIWSLVGSRTIEELIELPMVSDPVSLATLDVLTKIAMPALFSDFNLHVLVVCRAVNLSLEQGTCDGTCLDLVWLAMVAGGHFGDYQVAYRLGRLGYELVERRGLKRFAARVQRIFGSSVMPWTHHVRTGRDLIRSAFGTAIKTGDLTFAAFGCDQLNTNMLATGDPLVEVLDEAENGLRAAKNAQFGLVIDLTSTQLELVRSLRGLTWRFGSFDSDQFDERRIEQRFAGNPDLQTAECSYWIRKLQARYLACSYGEAVEAASKAQPLLWLMLSAFEAAEYHFYAALARAAYYDTATLEERGTQIDALAVHHRQLDIWSENCPENFANRAALVGAEIARLRGRDLEAERLYERAIHSACDNGFVHNEAIAYEVAARFYAARGFDVFARAYLDKARKGFLRWGADGKVRQLENWYPYLGTEKPAPGPTITISTSAEQLDLVTVMKVSEAISGEMAFGRLIETLMRTAIEHAGAARGLLILVRGNEYRIEAEATTAADTITVALREGSATGGQLPECILNYVVRTQESILLHDASSDTSFCADEYIQRHRTRSILCLPLLKLNRFIGMLYLENNLTVGVFTPARLAVLKLLASQAAVSLENSRLYGELQEREERVRRMLDSKVIGIYIWGREGQIIDANEAFLRIVGYSRAELLSRAMRWEALTPGEWRDADGQRMAELRASGTAQPYEKEYLQKGGKRVPVLVGAAHLNKERDEGVAFVVDLTERKRTEQILRDSERRYREVETSLAHANRIATMGQLSTSLAHEINQPIGAAVNNAYAALRWLGAEPPDINEARNALGRIVKNGSRAADVISRIRALGKKAPPRKTRLQINDAIREVIALTQGDAVKNGVSVHAQLAESLPLVQGDRVQLQQVILNLMMNAVEAMNDGGEGSRELMISTARGPSGVLVGVQDSGPGLDPVDLERVFEAFYSTKPDGLGIGLSICRSIIEAHGGRLWASSSAPKGALLQFTLPHAEDTSLVSLASSPAQKL